MVLVLVHHSSPQQWPEPEPATRLAELVQLHPARLHTTREGTVRADGAVARQRKG